MFACTTTGKHRGGFVLVAGFGSFHSGRPECHMAPDLSVIPCPGGSGPRQSSDCPENARYHPACTCTALLVLLDLARAKSSPCASGWPLAFGLGTLRQRPGGPSTGRSADRAGDKEADVAQIGRGPSRCRAVRSGSGGWRGRGRVCRWIIPPLCPFVVELRVRQDPDRPMRRPVVPLWQLHRTICKGCVHLFLRDPCVSQINGSKCRAVERHGPKLRRIVHDRLSKVCPFHPGEVQLCPLHSRRSQGCSRHPRVVKV